MKATTINKAISQKINEFSLSIKNKQLGEDLIKDCVVTGGCIASMFLQEEVNDFDLYLNNQTTVFRLAVYYIFEMQEGSSAPLSLRLTFTDNDTKQKAMDKDFYKKSIEAGEDMRGRIIMSPKKSFLDLPKETLEALLKDVIRIEIFVSSSGLAENDLDQHPESGDSEGTKAKYRPVFLSSNAITLSDKMQIVIRFVGDAEKVHESYDFIHATNYWTSKTGLVTNAQALEALLAKELIYRGSKYPLASIFRTRKFITRNWRIHIGNYVKMAMQLNEFDLTDIEVLEEQLTGVDALYLSEVINAIKSKKKYDPNFKFNSMYVCKLCDRMMGLREEI